MIVVLNRFMRAHEFIKPQRQRQSVAEDTPLPNQSAFSDQKRRETPVRKQQRKRVEALNQHK